MALKDHLTSRQPLGPINQSLVEDPYDAAALLEGAPPFLAPIEDRATIILGRRGSGKSSVLASYRSNAKYGHGFGRFPDKLLSGRDVVIPFFHWQQFHAMARNVGRELSISLKDNADIDFIFTETVSDIWQAFIWDGIFNDINSLYREDSLPEDDEDTLKPVIEYFQMSSIETTDLASEAAKRLFNNAKVALNKYLKDKDKSCYVLFDNIDEYPIRNPLIEAVISGFLRAIHHINANNSNVNIIICLPEEVESYLQEHSANIEKDFSSKHRMRWKPIDLLRIVAYRYRRFIEIHDKEFYKEIKDLDFSKRSDIIALFKIIMPHTIKNGLNYSEPTISYIIRHTQHIPRHFIIHFNELLTRAHAYSGNFRYIDEKSIIDGISEGEKQIAKQILKPYRDIYPKLLKSAELLLCNIPAICREENLDQLQNRFKGRYEEDISDIWKILYDIGVIGMVEFGDLKEKPDNNGVYVYAQYHYNSQLNFGKTSRRAYCIHPVFSKYFGLTRGDDSSKMAIYPKDVEEI